MTLSDRPPLTGPEHPEQMWSAPFRPLSSSAIRFDDAPAKDRVGRCLHLACAVTRRRFPVGASPTRQPLQPEAIGAVTEVTKWLKPSISVSRIGDSASVQAATRVNAEQALYGACQGVSVEQRIFFPSSVSLFDLKAVS